MKHVILLLLLSVLAFGQDIASTQQYEALINKADTELQDAQKLRDAKVRRATVLYIKALEKKKKIIMAKGDLDKANELDKEIKNLKPLIVKASPPKVTKTESYKDYIGHWKLIFGKNIKRNEDSYIAIEIKDDGIYWHSLIINNITTKTYNKKARYQYKNKLFILNHPNGTSGRLSNNLDFKKLEGTHYNTEGQQDIKIKKIPAPAIK